jgi:hypothetical protein
MCLMSWSSPTRKQELEGIEVSRNRGQYNIDFKAGLKEAIRWQEEYQGSVSYLRITAHGFSTRLGITWYPENTAKRLANLNNKKKAYRHNEDIRHEVPTHTNRLQISCTLSRWFRVLTQEPASMEASSAITAITDVHLQRGSASRR